MSFIAKQRRFSRRSLVHSHRGRFTVTLSVLLISIALAIAVFAAAIQAIGVAPRLLGPYLERRAMGHNAFIERTGVELNRLLQWLDRGPVVPRLVYPAWAVPPQAASAAAAPVATSRSVLVADAHQLHAALGDAQAGDVITLVPGTYRFEGRALDIARGGRPEAPISLRAPEPGSVTLQFALLEGFHVRAPYWTFENLTIIGACGDHDACEHAFHVVGRARGVVIRNNDLREFNAHVKINGADGAFPDGGRIEGNRLTNSSTRSTDAPVTPIDIVGASEWHIEGNFIADFVKDGGDRTSYGAFAKGGGSGNRFIRNIVLCEHRLRGAPGRRVGLSFGGGGSDRRSCRDGRCVFEHEQGLMRDNLIASCSDDGIYLNRSATTDILRNTLLDTAGINVRFAESAAFADGNLLDGPIVARNGATLRAGGNRASPLALLYLGIAPARSAFAAAADLDLRWRGAPPLRAAGAMQEADRAAGDDLCGRPRIGPPVFGAFADFAPCLRRADAS